MLLASAYRQFIVVVICVFLLPFLISLVQMLKRIPTTFILYLQFSRVGSPLAVANYANFGSLSLTSSFIFCLFLLSIQHVYGAQHPPFDPRLHAK